MRGRFLLAPGSSGNETSKLGHGDKSILVCEP